MDVLSLIPTHLDQQKDRFRASFVCRHWRSTFIQRAELWSQLFLSNGKVYTTTLLGRAKGSALNITVGSPDPTSTLKLLSSRSEQIKTLALSSHIKEFSEAVPGPYPLLHTLTIKVSDGPGMLTLPSHPLFSDAVNLKVFRYHSYSNRALLLSPFVLPNLVSFDLLTLGPFEVSQLLDFLENSPTLQKVHMDIVGYPSPEGVPQERVVILPNVKHLGLTVTSGGSGDPISAHISCPSARLTSIKHERDYYHPVDRGYDILPLVPWEANSVNEATLEIATGQAIKCRLAFRLLDGAIIELCANVTVDDEHADDWDEEDEDEERSLPHEEVYKQLFTEATGTIRNHPQLANIKYLRIHHGSHPVGCSEVSHIAKEATRLFEALGPLEELTIRFDPRPYLDSFLAASSRYIEEKIVFPQIEDLIISHPATLTGQQLVGAIAGLAQSQHAQGIPFGCVTIRDSDMPAGMEKELSPWVGSVKYCHSIPEDWDF